MKILPIIIISFAILSVFAMAECTPIDDCYIINESGNYCVTEDITGADCEQGILIQASDVNLTCQNYIVGGNLPDSCVDGCYYGIIDGNSDNVVITNCTITGWIQGIGIVANEGHAYNNVISYNNITAEYPLVIGEGPTVLNTSAYCNYLNGVLTNCTIAEPTPDATSQALTSAFSFISAIFSNSWILMLFFIIFVIYFMYKELKGLKRK